MSSIQTLSDEEIDDLLVELTDGGPVIVGLYQDVRDARTRILKFWEGLHARVQVNVMCKQEETLLTMKFLG
jgi:hypothetical protein